MELELYCIRHGETVADEEGILLGRSDLPLSPQGERQARELGRYLRRLSIVPQRIYTSPLRRASRFAELIARQMPERVPIEECELLNEIDLGSLTGTDRNNALGKGKSARPLSQLLNFKPYGGEDYFDLRRRAREFIRLIVRRHLEEQDTLFPTGPIFAVGHSGMLTQVLTERTSYPRPRLVFFKLDHAEVVRLILERRYGRVIARPDLQFDLDFLRRASLLASGD